MPRTKKTQEEETAVSREVQILAKSSPGVNLVEAMRLVNESGKRMLSNKETDAILQDDGERKKYSDLFPCRTGTLLISIAAGQPFKEFVKFSGVVFDVPKQFQGLTDKALIIEHPDWGIEEKEYSLNIPYEEKITRKITKIIASESKIEAIDYPKEDGYYLTEESHGVPNGTPSESSEAKARYLIRRDGEDYIGPLVRLDYRFGDYRRDILAYGGPDWTRGVGVVQAFSEKRLDGKAQAEAGKEE